MKNADWMSGTLKEDFCTMKKGETVFFRPFLSSVQLGAGVCWWIRPQTRKHFFSVAESYAGVDLVQLVTKHLDSNKKPRISPLEAKTRLNRELREFQSSLHKGAVPTGTKSQVSTLKPTIRIQA